MRTLLSSAPAAVEAAAEPVAAEAAPEAGACDAAAELCAELPHPVAIVPTIAAASKIDNTLFFINLYLLRIAN
jgi:hypothetical protein